MNNTAKPQVRVGVACFVWKEGRFLMAQRHGSHGAYTWSVPGGHLEFGESIAECASREVREETGMEISDIAFLAITEDSFPDDEKQYISIWTTAKWKSGNPQIMEPDKCSKLAWHTFHDLPSPLFEPCWYNLRAAKPELFS